MGYVWEACGNVNHGNDSDGGIDTTRINAELLVVMLHGLRGSSSDFDPAVAELRRSSCRPMIICRPTCNNGRGLFAPTLQGVRYAGDRAFEAIRGMLRENPHAKYLKRLVIIGHSFGGIYARYVAYLLADAGILVSYDQIQNALAEGETTPQLSAETFITFASPHLGIRRPRNGAWYHWRRMLNSVFHALAPVVGGFTGTELLHEDDDNILMKLTDQKYLRALKLFQKRVCYGNVFLDLQVPFCTSTMSTTNPFRASKYRQNPKYPSIVELVSSDCVEESKIQPAFCNDSQGGHNTRIMQQRLHSLGWQRVCCNLSPDAHNMIIGNNRLFKGGKDILVHLAAEVIK